MAQLQLAGTLGLFASSSMLWFAIFFVATSALAWFGAARHGQHTEDRWWVTSLRVSVAISTALTTRASRAAARAACATRIHGA